MKSNAKKFKQKLKKAIKRFGPCNGIYQDLKDLNHLNTLAVHLTRNGYEHGSASIKGNNHIEEWQDFYSSWDGKPNMGLFINIRSKSFLVLNWKPSRTEGDKECYSELL